MNDWLKAIWIKFLFLILFGMVSLPVQAQITQVWLGDANENGSVNHVDLLYWGLRVGDSGPARDSVSINWSPHNVLKWLPALAGRPDPSHADCNGNGTVDLQDIVAIEANYGLDNQSNLPDSSSLVTTGGQAIPLGLNFASGPWLAGTTDTIWIELGDSAQPVDSLLGFAATLSFDSSLIDTAYTFFADSWLGNPAQNLVSIDRYRAGSLDLAATRTDQTNRLLGNGRIGGVVVVMTENLKRAVATDSLKLEFTQVIALTSGINVVPVQVMPQTQLVLSSEESFEALVYPIPATSVLSIAVIGDQEGVVEGRLYDSQGAMVRSFQFDRTFTMARQGLQSGFYLLHLQVGEMVFRKRVIFLE